MVTGSDKLRDVVGDRKRGKGLKALTAAFDIETVQDLLQHYPRRYGRRGDLTDLDTLVPGEQATVMAQVLSAKVVPLRSQPGRRPRTKMDAIVTDGQGRLALTFFNQAWRDKEFAAGRQGVFSGKVTEFKGQLQIANPEVEWSPDMFEDPEATEAWANEVIPVYPATADVKSEQIRAAVRHTLAVLDPVPDPVPAELVSGHGLIGLDQAIHDIHQPPTLDDIRPARKRLAYDEALVLQLLLAQRRHEFGSVATVRRPGTDDGLLVAFDRQSGMTLTPGQQQVGAEIAADLAAPHPMHRLLQGDVGSGKTLVALRAMLQVIDSGGQAVLLAPTEVLAQQHFASLARLLGPLGQSGMLGGAESATNLAILTGSMSTAARRSALLDIVTGQAGIVVGTHALLQDTVEYHDLGLIVVDEQHRFGVEQRSALLARVPDQRPHLLVMTATPIPRTVAMTVFGDLDTSVMRDRPTGAPDIATHVVGERDQPAFVDRAWSRVTEEVAGGRQVFVVCPRIDEKDTDVATADSDIATSLFDEQPAGPTHAVTALAAELAEGPLADVRVGVLHGRMAAEDKESVMRRFTLGPGQADGIDVLVSTTVIEVGVDIPGASMMVIMDADRFGVSQLHQLRGRVGRSGQAAVCLLLTSAPVGSAPRTRLEQIAATNDGFALARLDLELRREGDVLGAAQSGRRSSLRLLSVLRDEDLITQARKDAVALIDADPDLADHELLGRAVSELDAEQRAGFLDKT
jgi:ATP-dependent DNA helicase RecG